MNVHHPRGEATKSTAIACLGAHWQYSFVSFNSSLTNTPVVFSSETAISLQNYPFQTGLSMLPLKRNIYPNFGQESGKKSSEEGTGTDASIETQQFEQKRFQDVAPTRTHTIFLLIDCFPSTEGDAPGYRPPGHAEHACFSQTEPGREHVPAAWLLRGAPTAARTPHPLRPLCSKGPTNDPALLQRDPLPPISCPPKAAQRSGAGGALGASAAARLPPTETRCGRGGGGQQGRPFPLLKCQILSR